MDKHAFEETGRGTTIVKSVQVFRTGTFKDSWGEIQTWNQEHIEQMASNFHTLRASGAFPNVPVRNDHSFSVTDVIGYFTDLRVEGEFLVADVEFTDSAALEKFDNGTYRSRSIEIGMYETNNQETYYPVVMGLAFVDIPAVEGLHGRPQNGIATFRQESPVPDAPTAPAAQAPAPHTFHLAGQGTTTDYGVVQAHITKIEGHNATLLAENTQYETKFAAAAKESRTNFVKQLATDNKIVGPQVEPMTTMVEGFTDDQFAQFAKAYEGAAVVGILQPHANAATASGPNGGQPPAAGNEDAPLVGEELLYAKVENFRMSGLSDEKIWNTETGKRLKALGKTLDK